MTHFRLPATPGAKQLKVFGYAPGNYSMYCLGCGRQRDGMDKMASSCKECAERRYKRVVLACAEEE